MPDPSVKKIINNGNLIAHLAPLLEGPEAAALARAARTYRSILIDFHVDVDTSEFDGCEQAQQITKWITTGLTVDAADLMAEWTAEIWSAIREINAGKLPT